MQDGFEGATEGNASAGSFVSGWRVDRDNVDVLGPNLFNFHGPAHSGTNFLDIHGTMDGVSSTNLATTPGTQYRVSFAYAASMYATIPTSARNSANVDNVLVVLASP